MKAFLSLFSLGSIAAGVFLCNAFAQETAIRASVVSEMEEQGVEHFYNLEYDEAIESYKKMLQAEPHSAEAHNHLADSYLYKQLLLAGALDGDLFASSNQFFRTKNIQPDPALDGGFHEHNDAAVQICEKRLKENSRDTEALYDCGVAYANRAAYSGLIARALVDTLRTAKKAQDFHQRLLALEPNRYDAYLVPGIYHFMLGSLPRSVRFFLFLGGFAGDKESGLQMIESVASEGLHSKYDAQIVLAVLYRREQRYDDARRMLEGLGRRFPRNYLFPLELASIYRRTGNDRQAVLIYEQALKDAEDGRHGYASAPLARIHFELGQMFANTGETEKAKAHLLEVTRTHGNNAQMTEQASVLLTRMVGQIEANQNKVKAP